MSKDIEQIKKQLDQMEKKIDDLNKKLDTHIDKIWQVYEGLRNPIKAVSKMFKKCYLILYYFVNLLCVLSWV